MKKTITKNETENKKAPTLGIQKLTESFKDARNKNRLSNEDWAKYLKLYADWKSIKTRGEAKDKAREKIRELFDNTIYVYYDKFS